MLQTIPEMFRQGIGEKFSCPGIIFDCLFQVTGYAYAPILEFYM